MMGHANVLLDREQSDHHAAFAPWIERVFPGMPYSVVLGPDREHQGAVACMAYFTTVEHRPCLLYTSPSPRDLSTSRMPSSA